MKRSLLAIFLLTAIIVRAQTYTEITSDQTNYTFYSGTTYYISGYGFNFNGTTRIQGGAVLKSESGTVYCNGPLICDTTADNPAVLTSKNDDSIGLKVPGSTGSPGVGSGTGIWFGEWFETNGASYLVQHLRFYYANLGIAEFTPNVLDCQFINCTWAIDILNYDYSPHAMLENVLFSAAGPYAGGYAVSQDSFYDGVYTYGENVTASNVLLFTTLNLTNSILVNSGYGDSGNETSGGQYNGFYNTAEFGTNAMTNSSDPFTSGGNADFYLATSSSFRNVGTTNIDTNLLAQLRTMTTYAPQDGGYPDTGANHVDLGYHYSVNEDSDHDGLPDWWEWQNFHSYAYSSTNLDAVGNTLLYDYTNDVDPNLGEDLIQFSVQFTNTYVNTTTVFGSLIISAGTPYYEAILINDTNTADAVWETYTGTNLAVSLPAHNGTYAVQVGLRGLPSDAVQLWVPIRFTLRTNGPALTITNPASSTVTIPMIQLQGVADEPLSRLTFAVSNALGVISNQTGYVIDEFYDTNQFAFTSNFFQCYDINVTNGLNTITLQATDSAGSTTTTNVSFTLNYSGVTNAPTLIVSWPPDGAQITAGQLVVDDYPDGTNTFELHGTVDDPTATIFATVSDAAGDTNTVQALVERDGTVVVQNLPLLAITNTITLTVRNAAGYTNQTTLTTYSNSNIVTMFPLSSDQLNQSTVSVGGYIRDLGATLTVNGQPAVNVGDGTWYADDVPVSPTGTAVFDLETTNSDGTFGTEIMTQPQPPTIVVMSFASAYNTTSTGVHAGDSYDNDYYDWSYATGGSHFGSQALWNQGEDDFNHIWNDPISSGVGALTAYFFGTFIPQNVSMNGTINNLWMLPIYGFGNFGPYTYSAHTDMMIVPSGQQASVGTVSYFVTASAMTYTNIDDATGRYSGEVPEAPTSIFFNGQQGMSTGVTNADGSVSAIAVVQGISGAQTTVHIITRDSASVTNVTLPHTSILANGFDLSTTTPQFCVGQFITFSPNLSNLPPGVQSETYSWNFTGNYMNDGTNAFPGLTYPTCSSNYFANTNLLTNQMVTNWWVSGGYPFPGATNTATLNLTLTFSNGLSSTNVISGNFIMFRPKIITATTTTGSILVDTNWGGTNVIDGGFKLLGFALHYGSSTTTRGIYFFQTMDAGPYTDGSVVNWVQVINTNSAGRELSNGTWYNGYTQPSVNEMLDVHDPLPPLSPNSIGDSPGVKGNQTNDLSLTENFSATMWLLFAPSGGQRVPLCNVTWYWSGTAVRSGTNWSITASNNIVNPPFSTTESYPLWTNNWQNFKNLPEPP